MNQVSPASPSAESREIILEFSVKKIAARQWGNPAGEPVLAVHGWLDNCASFDRMAPMLGGVNLIAVDLAGHGQSYHRSADANYNIWGEVEDILGIADALNWQQFSILGHSRGAVAAMLTAGTFPERIKRLALIDGLVPPPGEDSEAPEILAKAITQRARYRERAPRRFETLEMAVTARKNGLFKLSDAAARSLVERGVRPFEGGFTWSNDPQLLAASTAKLNNIQVDAFLARATMPIRLVLAHDGIADMIKRLKPVVERHENIAVREMPGGHHLHMEESAGEIADWFRGFLAGELD